MLKLLISSGIILAIAATVVGITKRNAGEVYESTSIVKTLNEATTTPPLTATTNVTLDDKKVVLKEYDLSGSRQVYITGVIDELNSPEIAKQILALGKDPQPMTIVINSPGGSVVDGAEIISAMEAAKGPVNTLCVQICASMAAMIHQYGTHRLMIDRSLVMFHPATGGVQGEVDKSYSRLTTLRNYIGEMEQNVAKRMNTSYLEYKAHSGVEMWLPAREAIKRGAADSIVYVRGTAGAKLYQPFTERMRSYYAKRIPFTADKTHGKFYFISMEAFNLLYGDASVEFPR